MKLRLLVPFAVTSVLAATVSPMLSFFQAVPAPLRVLVKNSDVVAAATVVSVEESPAPGSAERPGGVPRLPDNMTVQLKVHECRKGKAPDSVTIQIYLHACGTPPDYRVGRTVLAFLYQREEGAPQGTYRAHESLYPSAEDIPLFAARVGEALALQADPNTDRAARIEWLVACAEHPATRWHGLYELDGPGKPRPNQDNAIRVRPAELLSDGQRARIAQEFVREPRFDSNVVLVLAVLDTHRDERFNRTLEDFIDWEFESAKPDVVGLGIVIPAVLVRAGFVDPSYRPTEPALGGDDSSQLASLHPAWTRAKSSLVQGPVGE